VNPKMFMWFLSLISVTIMTIFFECSLLLNITLL